MTQIQISLPDSTMEFAGAQVSSGRFTSMSDYMQALIAADQQTQQAIGSLSDSPQVAALLEEGLAGGGGRRWNPEVLAELKQQVLDRAAGTTL